MGHITGALGRDVPSRVGAQVRFREAAARRGAMGQYTQVGAAVVFIKQPEGKGTRLPEFESTWSSHKVVNMSQPLGPASARECLSVKNR